LNKPNFRQLNLACSYLRKIGIAIKMHPSTEADPPASFSEGCWIEGGKLHLVARRCLVGAFIHEAAHLALVPKRQWRDILPGSLEGQGIKDSFAGAGELAAEAWGYCFAIAAGVPIEAAVHSNTSIATIGTINEEVTEEYLAETKGQNNRHGYYDNLSKAEFDMLASLIGDRHLGIKLLKLSGMTTPESFPKMERWLIGNQGIDFDFEGVLGKIEL
jgi:hypothetical protein